MPASFLTEPDEQLVVEARLDRLVVSEGLPVFRRGEQFFLPLGELCRALDLAVDVDGLRGLAAGFLIDEKKLFSLDVKFHQVEVAGRKSGFPAEAAFLADGDLYVEESLLETWLPIALDLRYNELLLRITAREKLPIETRLERESRLAAGRAQKPAADLPRLEVPYRLADGAFADASLRYSRREDGGGGNEQHLEYSLAATGELLFLEASLYLYGDEEGPIDARFQLGRKDPDGRLLGPLGAREIALGEVFHPGLELVALPSSGPGFLVSDFPLDRPSLFGRESFRGELPAGWEAELYRGDELIAFARSRPDGLYEFLEVPLLFGLNAFRIELYGPQGQRRTERRLRNVGDSLIEPGKLHYRLAGDDPGTRYFGPRRFEAGPRVSLEIAAGLSRRLSASASVASVEHRGQRSSFAQAGLRAFSGPLLLSFDLAAAAEGGAAWQAGLQSRWRGLRFELRHTAVDALPSEVFFASGEQLGSRSWLRFDTVLPAAGKLPRLPLYVALRQDRYTSGREQQDLNLRLAGFARGFSVTNQLLLSRTSAGGLAAAAKTAAGQLLLSKYLPSLAIRGEADYLLEPRAELTSLAIGAEWRRPGDYLLSAGASRSFSTGENRYQIGISRLEGLFGFTATADYGALGGLGLSVLVSSSFGRDGRGEDGRGAWHQQARPLAFSGGLAGRVFLDRNGNGAFDPGEEKVAGAGLRIGGANSPPRTGENGEIFLANLSPYQPVAIELAAETLEDPYWQPASRGVAIVPRPGKVAAVDLPVEVAGEISGTVYLEREGVDREAGGIELELVAPGGQVVARARSAGDGFYLLERLRPGRYSVQISAAQTARLGLAGKLRREVRLEADGTVLDNLDFRLTRSAG